MSYIFSDEESTPVQGGRFVFSDEEAFAPVAPQPLTREERIAQNQRAIERAQQPGEGETGFLGAVGESLAEGAKGAARAVKSVGGGIVGMASGAVRLAGTPVRAVTGWEGLHRLADTIDSSYENFGRDALMSEYGENPDGWGYAAGRFGEKLAGTAGSLAALGGPGLIAQAGKLPGAVRATGAAVQKALPYMFGNDAAVRAYDTARANRRSKAEAAALAGLNGAIHFLGFKAFENKALNKMLGMPAEMEAMMPKWANAAAEAGGQSFSSLARGVRNGMIKYTLAERGKGALRAGGIMGLQNFLSDPVMQVAEGASIDDIDFSRMLKAGAEGVGEGALMEGALGAAAVLKSPAEARKFIADKIFRGKGYKVVGPDGKPHDEPGLLNSSEGRMFLMKQNPDATERVLDIVEHGGMPRPAELDAAFLPLDMTAEELKKFASDWRNDLKPYVDEAWAADAPRRDVAPDASAAGPSRDILAAGDVQRIENNEQERYNARVLAREEAKAKAGQEAYDQAMLEREEARARRGETSEQKESAKNEVGTDEAPAQPEQAEVVAPSAGAEARPVESAEARAEAADARVVAPPAKMSESTRKELVRARTELDEEYGDNVLPDWMERLTDSQAREYIDIIRKYHAGEIDEDARMDWEEQYNGGKETIAEQVNAAPAISADDFVAAHSTTDAKGKRVANNDIGSQGEITPLPDYAAKKVKPVKPGDATAALKAVGRNASQDDTRIALKRVHVEGGQMVATDGRRLVVAPAPDGVADGNYDAIGAPIKPTESYVPYPAWRQVVPDLRRHGYRKIGEIANGDAAHGRIAFADETDGKVRRAKGGNLAVLLHVGNAGANPQFVKEVVNTMFALGAERLEVFQAPDYAPVVFKGRNARGEITGVVMPLRVDGKGNAISEKGTHVKLFVDGSKAASQTALAQSGKAATEGSAKRRYTKEPLVFKEPYVGKTGAKLTSYLWENKPEEYIDMRGEERTRRVSDWDNAEENPFTRRGIVHQFTVETTDGNVHVVSAETAAKILGVSESTIRTKGSKAVEQAIKQARMRKIETESQKRDADNLTWLNQRITKAALDAYSKLADKGKLRDAEHPNASVAVDEDGTIRAWASGSSRLLYKIHPDGSVEESKTESQIGSRSISNQTLAKATSASASSATAAPVVEKRGDVEDIERKFREARDMAQNLLNILHRGRQEQLNLSRERYDGMKSAIADAKPVKIKGVGNGTAGIVKVGDRWRVVDLQSGFYFGDGANKADAIAESERRIGIAKERGDLERIIQEGRDAFTAAMSKYDADTSNSDVAAPKGAKRIESASRASGVEPVPDGKPSSDRDYLSKTADRLNYDEVIDTDTHSNSDMRAEYKARIGELTDEQARELADARRKERTADKKLKELLKGNDGDAIDAADKEWDAAVVELQSVESKLKITESDLIDRIEAKKTPPQKPVPDGKGKMVKPEPKSAEGAGGEPPSAIVAPAKSNRLRRADGTDPLAEKNPAPKTVRKAVDKISLAISNRTGTGVITPDEAYGIVKGIAESPGTKHNRTRDFFNPLENDAKWHESLGLDAESAKNLRDAFDRVKADADLKKWFPQVDAAVKKANDGRLSKKDAAPLFGKISEGLEKAERMGLSETANRLREAAEVIRPVAETVEQGDVNKFNYSTKGQKLNNRLGGTDKRGGKTVSLDTKNGTVDVRADGKGSTLGGNRHLIIDGVKGDELTVTMKDAAGKTLATRKMNRAQWSALANGAVATDGDPANPQKGDLIRMSRSDESPAERDLRFASDENYQKWLKSRKANDAEPLRERYEQEQAKAAKSIARNTLPGVDVEVVDRAFNPETDGGVGKRKSIGGIFTGGPNDYANRSRQGGVDDGPSLKSIGTGEGAQVYGWGLYGSNRRGVAESYARAGKNKSANVYEQTFFTDRAPGDESHLLKWYSDERPRNLLKNIRNNLSPERLDAFNRAYNKAYRSGPGGRTQAVFNGDVYKILSDILGSSKSASEFLRDKCDIDGVKYPVDSYRGPIRDGDKAGWNYVSFRDDNIRVDHKWEDGQMRYLRDGEGRVVGTFDRSTNKVTLYRGATAATLVHELGGHATLRFAEQEAERGNRQLLDRINRTIDEAPQALKDEIRSRYPGVDETALRDEIWAALRERNSPAMEKAIKTLQGKAWYNRAWSAFKDAWKGLLARMGFNRADLSQIDKMSNDEFLSHLDRIMSDGKTLGRLEAMGEGTRNAFAGTKGAERLGIGKFADAEQMEKDGASREDIWRKTGWWRGKDGQWRVELPPIAIDGQKLKQLDVNRDNYNFRKRKAQPEYHARLEDLIADKQLVAKLNAAYGTLPHISVVDDVGWALGRFRPDANSIDIHRHMTAAEMRSVVEHELQHFIQHKEGFPEGGDNTGGEYRNLEGEVEARNVQARLGMTPEERAATPPWETEDVPEDRQIVRTDGGIASSVRESRRIEPPRPDGSRIMDDQQTKGEKFTEKFIDSFAPVKSVQGEIGGVKEVTRADGYTDHTKSTDLVAAKDKANGRLEHEVRQHQFRVDDINRDLARAALPKQSTEDLVDDFNLYLQCKHAPERNLSVAQDRGDVYTPNYSEGMGQITLPGGNRIGLSENVANRLLKGLRGKYGLKIKMFENAADKVYKMLEADLDRRFDAGRLSAEDYAFYKTRWHGPGGADGKWAHYVPLKTDIERLEPEALNSSTAGMKRSEFMKAQGRGSGDIADSPLAAAVLQTEQGIRGSIRNEVANVEANLVEHAQKQGKPIAEIVPGDEIRRGRTYSFTFADGETVDASGSMRLVENHPEIHLFKRDGKLYAIRYDKGANGRGLAFARAASGENMGRWGQGTEWIPRMTHWMSAMRTQYSPEFTVSNWLADHLEAAQALVGRYGLKEGGKAFAKTVASEIRNAKDLFRYLNGGQANGYIKEFVEGGGLTKGGVASEGFDAETQKIRSKIEQFRREQKQWREMSPADLAKSAGRHVADFLSFANELAEYSTRTGLYTALRKQGVPQAEAIKFARDATVNFNRKGTAMPYINGLYMFANASVQGAVRSVQAMRDTHGKELIAALTAIGVAKAVIDNYLGNDDEREAAGGRNARNQSEYDKKHNVGVPIGGGRQIVPLRFRGPYAAIPYLAQTAANVAMGVTSPEDGAKTLVRELGDQVTDIVGGNGIMNDRGEFDGSLIGQSIAPSVADPIVQLATGKDYKGDERRRKSFDKTMPASSNGKRNTGDWYKVAAQTLNRMSGGNEHRKGLVDVAPEDLQLVLEFLGGAPMRDFNNVVSSANNAIQIASGGTPERTLSQIPFVRRVVREYPESTSRYYDALEDYERDKAEFKKTTPERRREMKSEKPYLFTGKSLLDGQIERIKELTHLERGEVKVGQKWMEPKTPRTEAQKEEWRKKRLALQAQILERLGR